MGPETINSFARFLDWGAVGLAGLMMVLAIFALVSGKLTAERAGILKTFLYVGAFCFVAALVAQVFGRVSDHELTVQVLPNDLVGSDFPDPSIKANGQDIDRSTAYIVNRPTSLSVDVSQALGLFQRTAESAEKAAAEVDAAREELTVIEQEAEIAANRVREQAEEVRRLEQETRLKEEELMQISAELEEKEARLVRQEDQIREAVAQAQSLAGEVRTLAEDANLNPNADQVRDLENIQRTIRQLNQDLRLTIRP